MPLDLWYTVGLLIPRESPPPPEPEPEPEPDEEGE
jgi:hypothetical protein